MADWFRSNINLGINDYVPIYVPMRNTVDFLHSKNYTHRMKNKKLYHTPRPLADCAITFAKSIPKSLQMLKHYTFVSKTEHSQML